MHFSRANEEGRKREIRMQRKRNSGTKQRGGNGKRYMGKKNGKRMNRETNSESDERKKMEREQEHAKKKGLSSSSLRSVILYGGSQVIQSYE